MSLKFIIKESERSSLAVRLRGGVLLIACAAVLVAAARLDPAPRGMGTHTQLGLPACGWLERTGKPCPTCGMTTAFTLAAHGSLGQAFATQPVGAFGALVIAMLLWVAGWVAATGCVVPERIVAIALRRPWLCGTVMAAVVGAGWAYTLWGA